MRATRTGLLALAAFLAPGPIASPGETPSEILFSDVTAKAGLVEPLAGLLGHGGAFGDFDGDGRVDLFVGGFCDRPNAEYAPAAGPVPNRLFRNLGDGRFELSRQPPVETFGRASGAVFADLDNDGDLDLYVANNAKERPGRGEEPQRSAQILHSKLYRNDHGTFVEVPDAGGACPDSLHTARNVGVIDFDGDGLLDLFVVEDRFIHGGDGPRCILFRNKGSLVFEDANRVAGIPDDLFGLGFAAADLNDDSRPDFFVPHSNRLFLSRAGGGFREAVELRETFAWQPLDGEDWPCGACFGDLNRDGRMDLVLSIHHAPARNRVYLNEGVRDGVPRFRDVTAEAGLGDPVPVRCPHVEIQDFDNDGWPDIYFSAAWVDGDRVTPLVYRHQGIRDGIPRFVPPRPVRPPMVYFPAGPTGDFDGDGRLDLFLVNWFAGNRCRLLRNESPPRNWLDVRVTGTKMNRMGIGARVSLYSVLTQARQRLELLDLLGGQEVQIGYGYASGQEAVCHFGLGDRTEAQLLLSLPGRTSIRKVAANQRVTLSDE